MKRWLFKLVVFLILGAITNIAVAWGFVLGISLTNRTGEYQVINYAPKERDLRYTQTMPGRTRINWITQNFIHDPLFSRSHFQIDISRSGSCDLAGWPLRTLSCSNTSVWTLVFPSGFSSRYNELNNSSNIKNGFKLPPEYHTLSSSRLPIWRALPYRPIWPEIAINTIFYATILWLLTLGPFTTRRIMRHKCGHCIKCGYDLRGDSDGGCPECGWGREAEA